MPLDTPYNQRIAKKLHEINKNHINTEILNSEKILHNNVFSPLENIIEHNTRNIGSGHQAVAESEIKLAEKAVDQQSNIKPQEPKTKRKSKTGGSGFGGDNTATVRDEGVEPIGNLSGQGFSGAGVSAAGKPKKTKTKKRWITFVS